VLRADAGCGPYGKTGHDLCLVTADVWSKKAEACEGVFEGAEALPTDFFNDLQCFC